MLATSRRDEILDVAARALDEFGVRVSLEEIASRCGIQAGSLYHHFESKDALMTALLERLQADIGHVTAPVAEPARSAPSASLAITELADKITRVAERNRAALALTYIDPPSATSEPMRERASRVPEMITSTMRALLARGQADGEIRADLDPAALAALICDSVLQTAVGVHVRTGRGQPLSRLKSTIMLTGAVRPAARGSIAGDAAHRAVDDLVLEWRRPDDDAPGGERRLRIQRAALAECGRKGAVLTTVRDIAAAAGVDVRTVYRAFSSKDDLVRSILDPYFANFRLGWQRVVESEADPVSRLDALLWLVINVHDRFREEQRVAELTAQQAPPAELASGHGPLAVPMRQLRALLAEADAAGVLRADLNPRALRTAAIFAACFGPANIAGVASLQDRLALARASVLDGIAVPPGRARQQ